MAAYFLVSAEDNSSHRSTAILGTISFVAVFLGLLPSLVDQMETACAMALMLWGAMGLSCGRSWGMPLLMLACFTRYECVLLFLLAGAWITRQKRWTPATFISTAAIGAIGVAWLEFQYGTVVRNTLRLRANCMWSPSAGPSTHCLSRGSAF
jgi:hypothetical protein